MAARARTCRTGTEVSLTRRVMQGEESLTHGVIERSAALAACALTVAPHRVM